MVKRCCINKCNRESYRGISFHSFPLLEELKQKWLDVIPLSQKITKDSVVCSLHFKPDDFHDVDSKPMLKADVVPTIFPVTCMVQLQPLPAKTSKRLAGQPRDVVPIKVRSGPKFLKLNPEANPDVTEIKTETDLIESEENPQSEDTLSLAVDNDQLRDARALDPLADVKVEELDVVDEVETSNQADQIIQLTESCAQDSQKLRSLVELVRQKDKTISELRTEVRELMNYIAKRSWEASSKMDATTSNKQVNKEHNRHILIVKRDFSPDRAQPTSDIQTSNGIKRTLDGKVKSS